MIRLATSFLVAVLLLACNGKTLSAECGRGLGLRFHPKGGNWEAGEYSLDVTIGNIDEHCSLRIPSESGGVCSNGSSITTNGPCSPIDGGAGAVGYACDAGTSIEIMYSNLRPSGSHYDARLMRGTDVVVAAAADFALRGESSECESALIDIAENP